MQNVAATTNPTIFRNILEVTLGLLIFATNIFRLICGITYFVVEHILDEIIATEHIFLLMTNLYAFLCQFFFFTLCEIAILKVESKHKRGKVVSGLTTLLLYSIITYFATKVRDTLQNNFDRTRSSQTTRDLILKVIKIILEFGKAAIVILCLREQGLHYHFDAIYSATTFIYYLSTEKIFVDGFIYFAKLFNAISFDSLEHLYVPIILHLLQTFLSTIVIGYLLITKNHILYALLSSYFTIYLPLKDLIWNYLNPLVLEQQTYASFKVATNKEISNWDDICAVCLERMSRARITPCNHFFHPQCLKRCLQTSMQCPLCKKDFVQAN